MNNQQNKEKQIYEAQSEVRRAEEALDQIDAEIEYTKQNGQGPDLPSVADLEAEAQTFVDKIDTLMDILSNLF